jgi:hypothetical protein
MPMDVAAQTAHACGPRSSTAEHVCGTVWPLKWHGLPCRNLWRLQRLMAEEVDPLAH